MNFIIYCLSFLLLFSIGKTQEDLPPVNLVSLPTAGTLQQGTWTLDLHLQRDGGVLSNVLIGMTSNFSLGLSYGIQSLIGDSLPSINRATPEVQVKYRLFEESELYPAILLGLNTQGLGTFTAEDSVTNARYDFKAVGFYTVLSKNWDVMGNLGLHLGANINTWEGDTEENLPNFFVGIDKNINRSIILLMEYNFGLNDKSNPYFNLDEEWPGFFNSGIRWSLSDNLQAEISFNLIRESIMLKEVNREIRFIYNQTF